MLLMLPPVIICPLFLFIMHAYVPLYVQVLVGMPELWNYKWKNTAEECEVLMSF